MNFRSTRTLAIISIVLIIAIVAPAILLAFFVTPWFWLFMIALLVVPGIFILRE